MELGKAFSKLGVFAVLVVCSSGISHAYTRAYLTNGTGMTVYGLHVKLTNPALAGSLGSGIFSKIFGQIAMSPDGTELIFLNPTTSQGIQDGSSVWIGWTDAKSGLPSDIFDYWWTDLSGNMVGGVQSYDANKAADDGLDDLLSLLQSGPGGGGGGGDGFGDEGGYAFWPGGWYFPGISFDSNGGSNGNPFGNGGGNGAGNAGANSVLFRDAAAGTGADAAQLIATPEAGSLGSVACGLVLVGLGLLRRRLISFQ